ncbi:MAG: phosphate ABC transporter permease subunit PstC [Polyangiaceae bacterium]|jgi:phosphate transport system permease protein|nr:phosphate ABC transporter permease subunit PstC [Polyangiaceae bacterium]
MVAAVVLLLVVAAIAVTLVGGAAQAFGVFGPSFLWSRAWDPVRSEFGALPSLLGTLISAVLALGLAVPVSVGIAVFLTELAPAWLARPASTAVEVLAAIPSIIYGMWGLFVVAPLVADHLQPALTEYLGFLPLFRGPPMGIGMLTAALVLAVMVIPYISAVARDLFSMVPIPIKEAAVGVGATRWEVVRSVVLPYTRSGLIGAIVLGLGRALGETMAATFVIGNSHHISASLYAPSNTIASTLANEFTEATDALHVSSLMALALCLFLLTFLLLAFGRLLVLKSARRGMMA